MRVLCALGILLAFATPPCNAQLPRIGSSMSTPVRAYFGVAPSLGAVDSLLVVQTNSIVIVGMRGGVAVDSVSFRQDEVPILERYLRDYESLIASPGNVFVNDSALRRIVGRVNPGQRYNSTVRPVSLRLVDGTVITGIPLSTTKGNFVISASQTFNPRVDLERRAFQCVPLTSIDAITCDDEIESRVWYVVRGSKQRMRTAMRLCFRVNAYEQGVPPEVSVCAQSVEDSLVDELPPSPVRSRSTGWSFPAFVGVAATLVRPLATVTRYDGVTESNDTLGVQQFQYVFGVEALKPLSPTIDLGLRAMLLAQPPTIMDSSAQHSLGFDVYSVHALFKWYVIPIDVSGHSNVELSTTIGLGPDFISYRGRTYRELENLTTRGSGLAVTASWSVQCMMGITRSLSVGLQGALWYQHGLSFSMDTITIESPLQKPWSATFTMQDQTASFLGANLVVCYTFPSSFPEE